MASRTQSSLEERNRELTEMLLKLIAAGGKLQFERGNYRRADAPSLAEALAGLAFGTQLLRADELVRKGNLT